MEKRGKGTEKGRVKVARRGKRVEGDIDMKEGRYAKESRRKRKWLKIKMLERTGGRKQGGRRKDNM